MTHMVYIDETGDVGDPSLSGASACFALGCVILDLDAWSTSFDRMQAFRRDLRDSFGIPVRAELKANYLTRGSGPLRRLGLAPSQRQYIYRRHLSVLQEVGAEVFAVVLDKQKSGYIGQTCFDKTWEMVIQRLDRMTQYEHRTTLITHDEGDADRVRKHVRRSRRYLTAGQIGGGGSLSFQATGLLEDPIPRDSSQSYLIQSADLVAYSGWRTYMAPGKAVSQIVDSSTWDALGSAVKGAVNSQKLNGSVPGVVLRTS